MSQLLTVPEDAWAWAHETKPDPPDVSGLSVHVLIPQGVGAEWLPGLLSAVAGQTVSVSRVSVGAVDTESATADLPPTPLPVEIVSVQHATEFWTKVVASDDGDELGPAEFCWVLSGDCIVPPDTLEKLLRTMVDPAEQAPAATGPVVLRQPTRRSDAVIEWVGATLTSTGVPISDGATGEVNQGQVERPTVLGLPMAGLLVRTSALRETGGFGSSPIAGLEVGALSTLAGGRWVVTGDAEIVLIGPGTSSPAATRRAGMNLATALSRFAPWQAFVTIITGLIGAFGDLLVRDPRQAGVALSALAGWARDWSVRRRLRARIASLPQADPAAVSALRPRTGTRLRMWLEQMLGRLGDWIDGFSVRVDSGSALDDLTATDSSGASVQWKLPPALVGLIVLTVGSCVALIHLFRGGLIVGAQLLPAPGYADLWATYLTPGPGQPGGSGPPWVALVGLLSTVTIGNVDLAVMAVLVLSVPLTWLACYRLLRLMVLDHVPAVWVAVVVALSPVLVGATNRGDIGTSVAVLFGILGALSARRLQDELTWRWAATAAICVTIVSAIFPALWVPTVLVAITAAILRRVGWGHVVLVAIVPVIFLASWAPTIWRWPGRVLTGPEPLLTNLDAPGCLDLLLARDAGSGLPPLWISIAVISALGLVAIIGLIRVGSRAWLGWAVAALGFAGAIGVSRAIVSVPPGIDVRPGVSVWLVMFISGLALAAAQGAEHIIEDLRGTSLGWRQPVVGLLAVIAGGACVIAGGWWMLGGATGPVRDDLAEIAPYVRKAQQSDAPGRTLAISIQGNGQANWALLEDDLPRLGDGERGLAAGGSPTVTAQTGAIVDRLLAGTTDDLVVSDLRAIGVGYVWVRGAGPDHVANVGNTPGLGTGSSDDVAWVWQVPLSGRAVVTNKDQTVVVGNGVTIPAANGERVLMLSEPSDARWQASVDGFALEPLPSTDWRQRFAIPAQGGRLVYGLQDSSWWAWVQLALLALGAVMVAPTHRSAVGARGGMS